MRGGLRLLVLSVCIALLGAACGGDADSVAVGGVPSFDGCDSAGDITNYMWVIRSAPPDMASDAGKVLREVLSECSFSLVRLESGPSSSLSPMPKGTRASTPLSSPSRADTVDQVCEAKR